jgi:hypothetical protein
MMIAGTYVLFMRNRAAWERAAGANVAAEAALEAATGKARAAE